MAYKYNGRIIRAGRAWSNDEGIQHPGNWMLWSDAEKTAAGLVWEDDPAPFDNRFYWAAGVPKDLEDRINEDDTISEGLRSLYKRQTKETANAMLSATDWYAVRKAETGDVIPSEVLVFRDAVRQKSGEIEALIDGEADLDAFIALFDAPEDGNAPIHDWPEEV